MTRARAGDDYEVGYGKPPKAHQFPKGKSPNPKGRPKRNDGLSSAGPIDAQFASLVMSEANRMVSVRENQRVENVPMKTALLRSLMAMALRGDRRAQSDVVKLITSAERTLEVSEPPVFECPNCSRYPGGASDEELIAELFELARTGHLVLPPGSKLVELPDEDDCSDLA